MFSIFIALTISKLSVIIVYIGVFLSLSAKHSHSVQNLFRGKCFMHTTALGGARQLCGILLLRGIPTKTFCSSNVLAGATGTLSLSSATPPASATVLRSYPKLGRGRSQHWSSACWVHTLEFLRRHHDVSLHRKFDVNMKFNN